MCNVCYLGLNLKPSSARVFCSVIFKIYFSDHKDIWIPATDCYMYFYVIELCPLMVILHFINR